ncbi:hypothetical protein BJX99DRAFT_253594 [Aspergillus californicus]
MSSLAIPFQVGYPSTIIGDKLYYTSAARWSGMKADAAWVDIVRIWKETDSESPAVNFTQSVSSTLRIGIRPTAAAEYKAAATQLAACPGLDSLNGAAFGSIRKKDLVAGSINTWSDNSEENTTNRWEGGQSCHGGRGIGMLSASGA